MDSWQPEIKWRVDKYDSGLTHYETVNGKGNLLMFGGASAIWELFIGETFIPFDNANAYLAVGDSAAVTAATQTDLQAASNKVFMGMDMTYPLHVDGTASSSNASITFKATFGTSDANFVWAEWGLFNGNSSDRMLNRKVAAMGTKVNGETWTLTVSITLS